MDGPSTHMVRKRREKTDTRVRPFFRIHKVEIVRCMLDYLRIVRGKSLSVGRDKRDPSSSLIVYPILTWCVWFAIKFLAHSRFRLKFPSYSKSSYWKRFDWVKWSIESTILYPLLSIIWSFQPIKLVKGLSFWQKCYSLNEKLTYCLWSDTYNFTF